MEIEQAAERYTGGYILTGDVILFVQLISPPSLPKFLNSPDLVIAYFDWICQSVFTVGAAGPRQMETVHQISHIKKVKMRKPNILIGTKYSPPAPRFFSSFSCDQRMYFVSLKPKLLPKSSIFPIKWIRFTSLRSETLLSYINEHVTISRDR